MKDLIVLKIGGSVFACKDSAVPKVDRKALERICKEIGNAFSKIKDSTSLIIVHGAGSYGHIIVKRTGIDKGIKSEKDALAFAETQQLQNELNLIVTKELLKNGIPAFPFQSSDHAIMSAGSLKSMSVDAAKGLLKSGLVPVAYGIPAYDEKQGCSILSGDQIAPYLAQHLAAKKIIHATDVDGVYTGDPKKDNVATLIKEITSKSFSKIKSGLSGSMNVDVTGGMLKKVSELIALAEKGIPSQLVNGTKPGLIEKALLGGEFGTMVR